MQVWLPVVAFAVLWLDLIRQLSYQWEANEQYAYGWFVPFFAAALLWRRWLDRAGVNRESRKQKAEAGKDYAPVSVEEPKSRNLEVDIGKDIENLTSGSSIASVSGRDVRADVVPSPISYLPSSNFQLSAFALPAFCFLMCLLLLPLRIIHEINQDWPLITWPYTLIVVFLTLYAFHLADPHPFVVSPPSSVLSPQSVVRGLWSVVRHPWSVVSPWVRHFAFPICFILVAVKWPYRIEKGLTQYLMEVVASLTVEMLGWLNVPALQRGNLVEIGTGVVGVDEACSGIRSFQSTLMAALLMGELYRLRMWARASLVGLGLLIAFGFNVIRALILTCQANAHGLDAITSWHDPAGMTITIACFFCLWAVTVLIQKWSTLHGRQSLYEASHNSYHVSSPSARNHLTCESAPLVSDLKSHPSSRPYKMGLFMVFWVAFVLIFNEGWYQLRTPQHKNTVKWSVVLPIQNSTFRELTLSPKEVVALKCDARQGGSWKEPDGTQWSAWFFAWTSQSITSLIAARCHRPEVCLPASGRKMQADHGLRWYTAGDLQLPFRTYTFDNGEVPLHVFFCLWQDGTEQFPKKDQLGSMGRLWAAAKGKRLLGQQTFEIIVENQGSFEAAEKAVRQRLPQLIKSGEHKDKQAIPHS